MNKIYQKTFPGEKNAGFTLIELLVVVLIIGILAAVALPQYELAVEKSRWAEVKMIRKSIHDAAALKYLSGWETGTALGKNATIELDIDLPQLDCNTSSNCSSSYFSYKTVFTVGGSSNSPVVEFYANAMSSSYGIIMAYYLTTGDSAMKNCYFNDKLGEKMCRYLQIEEKFQPIKNY